MIESRNMVPETYNKSRDYQSVLKLLDLIACGSKFDTDNLISCLDPERCPSQYLPLLASYYGYEFDYDLSFEANRTIIKYYPDLLRLRGSAQGIKLAIVIAIIINGSYRNTDVDSMLNVQFDETDKTINTFIYFDYSTKIYDLLEAVRPAGYAVYLRSAVPIRTDKDDFDQIAVRDKYQHQYDEATSDVTHNTDYDEIDTTNGRSPKSPETVRTDGNRVGFSEVTENDEEE